MPPVSIETKIQGMPVKLTVETAYPFRDEVAITAELPKGKSLPLHLRIPDWADKARIRVNDTDLEIDIPKQGWKHRRCVSPAGD